MEPPAPSPDDTWSWTSYRDRDPERYKRPDGSSKPPANECPYSDHHVLTSNKRGLAKNLHHLKDGYGVTRSVRRQRGFELIYWLCPHCTYQSPPLAHDVLRENGIEPSSLVLYDDTAEQRCEYLGCENVGFDNHHWAPRSVFDDSNNWPIARLCARHHTRWHTDMVGYRWHGRAVGAPGNDEPNPEWDWVYDD